MRRLILILGMAIPSLVRAQSLSDPLPRIRYVVIDDYVRDYLSKEWDAHLHDAKLLERGYCLGYQLDFWAGEIAYRVTQIAEADSVQAQSSRISFSCKGKFKHTAEIHIHPPNSCLGLDGPCFPDGVYAWQCQPSDTDKMWLNHMDQPFSMIQCSREAIIYWLPDEKAHP